MTQHSNITKTTRLVLRVVITTGISSVVTQLLIIREFLAQFQGNEFVIALILFNWLLLGGCGTYLAHFTTRKWRPSIQNLCYLSMILVLLAPSQFLLIRILRDVFFIHGSAVGFYPTYWYILLTVAPYCLLLGFLLPYSLSVIRKYNPQYPGTKIYLADNLGDVSGGALFSFILVNFLTPMQAVALGGIPLLTATYLLFPPSIRKRQATVTIFIAALCCLLLSVSLETFSLKTPAGTLAHYEESRYGRISVYRDQEQFTLFADGSPLYSTQNENLAEETIHFPLSQLDSIDSVLVISAEGGMFAEIAKHSPEIIDYVELDPVLTRVQFQYGILDRVDNLNVINNDGRAFLATSNKKYDAIICNLPEPETFQLNRFYTDSFFALVHGHLTERGVFSFSMEGFDNYLAEPQRQKLSTLYNTVRPYFTDIQLLPGQKIFFLCANRPIDKDIPSLLHAKNIAADYISYFFYGNLTEQRISYLTELLDPQAAINNDLKPQLMRIMYLQWFAEFSTSPALFYAVLVILLFAYFIQITREEFVLFSTGATTMGAEILVIFAFQIFFGYIYLQIGLIVTIFLAGLLPGAWFGESVRQQGKKLLIITDVILIVLLCAFIGALTYGQNLPVHFFMIFGLAVSLACGFQFPIALHLRGGDSPAVVRTFSADLIGAAAGTLVTSVYLIPYLGILWTTSALIGLKLASILVTAVSHGKN